MAKQTIIQAIQETLHEAMSKDENVVLLGQDIGRNGGVFRITDGLIDDFGAERVIDTPIAESGIIGSAIGMSLNGLRPIAEIQFLGFIYEAMDQIANQAAKMRYRSAGRFTTPIVIRSPYGGGVRTPELHSDSLEAAFNQVPGLQIVMPSNVEDAKGLLRSAIKSNDPVLFLEPMKLYRANPVEVSDEYYEIPLGKAKIVHEGYHATIVSWGPPVLLLNKLAETYKEKDIHLEIIDLRTINPLDIETIIKSVEKTERLMIVHEAVKVNGVGAEIVAQIAEKAIFNISAPIMRVTGYDTPYPVATIEDEWLPNEKRIKNAIDKLLSF